MINYFEMKRKEIELKLLVYGYLLDTAKDNRESIEKLISLWNDFKTMTKSEFKKLLLKEIDKLINDSNR